MLTPRSGGGPVSADSTGFSAALSTPLSKAVQSIRHELVDAQVEVLRTYLEKRSQDSLLAALDRLIECTRISFREEEELMERLTSTLDAGHREMHDTVLAQLELLRQDMEEFDRARLLAQLILVDRQLTSHISSVATVPERWEGVHLAECDSLSQESGGRHPH